MKIAITGNRKVADVQKEFNVLFPFLNLEFFDLSEDDMISYVSSGKKFPQFYIKDIRVEQKDGELLVNRNMTVMQLENLLSEEFGLQAQVFVRSENRWVRSSLKGYWTLFYKNEAGRIKTANYHSSY